MPDYVTNSVRERHADFPFDKGEGFWCAKCDRISKIRYSSKHPVVWRNDNGDANEWLCEKHAVERGLIW